MSLASLFFGFRKKQVVLCPFHIRNVVGRSAHRITPTLPFQHNSIKFFILCITERFFSIITSPPPPMRSQHNEQSLADINERLVRLQNNPQTYDRFHRSSSAHSSYASTEYDENLHTVPLMSLKEQRERSDRQGKEFYKQQGWEWPWPPTPPTPPLPSEEERALKGDAEKGRDVGLSLDDLPRGYRGGISDINPATRAADEERIRHILLQFYEEGMRGINTLIESSFFWYLQWGLTRQEYIEKRLDEIFAEHSLIPPSKLLQPPLSKEEIALREDGRWVRGNLRLDDLRRGYWEDFLI